MLCACADECVFVIKLSSFLFLFLSFLYLLASYYNYVQSFRLIWSALVSGVGGEREMEK